MEIRQLEYFLGVANELHFSKAAEKLFVAQPALSRQIQQLENEWDTLLFERNKRNVKLTPAGEFLKEEATRVLNQLEYIKKRTQQINKGDEGELRIGHPGSAIYSVIPKLLLALQQSMPKVKPVLSEICEVTLMKDVKEGQMDIGFIREIQLDDSLESKVVSRENLALALPQNHWLTEENFKNMRQLKDENFVLPTRSTGVTYYEILINICRNNGFSPNIAFESSFGATILNLVEHNLGISILPYSYHLGASSRIRFIELKDIPIQTELTMIWRKDNNNPMLKNLLRIAEALFQIHI